MQSAGAPQAYYFKCMRCGTTFESPSPSYDDDDSCPDCGLALVGPFEAPGVGADRDGDGRRGTIAPSKAAATKEPA